MDDYNLVQDCETGICKGSLKVSSDSADIFFRGEGCTFDEVITNIDSQIIAAGL